MKNSHPRPKFEEKVIFLNPKADPGIGVAREGRAWVPDSEYHAQAVAFKVIPFLGTEKIYYNFRVIQGPYQGDEIWLTFQAYKKYGPRSKFYKAYALFLGRKPSKGEKLIPGNLLNSIFLIRTRTVIKDEDGDNYPEHQRYSVVDKILEVIQKNQSQ